VHLDAALAERQCDATCSNREFERGSRASKLGEEGDGRLRVEGTLLDPLVVDLGEAVPVGRESVLLDGLDPSRDMVWWRRSSRQFLRVAQPDVALCQKRDIAPAPVTAGYASTVGVGAAWKRWQECRCRRAGDCHVARRVRHRL
jgi:hypothetical protein